MTQATVKRPDTHPPRMIPVIDAAAFAGDAWLPALDAACADWGCFALVNHGVDAGLVAATRRQMRAFFALPGAAKLAIERSHSNPWGFFDRELTKNVRDWKEIFDFGPACNAGPMGGSEPQWPAGMTGFREVMEDFFAACEAVAQELVAGIGRNLGMNADHLSAEFTPEHTSFVRLNYYPPCAAPDRHLGISPHTDAGAVTVLLADDVPGLQFDHLGHWHTVAPIEGALIINIGDIVQVWSNDRYRAPLHRVLANADRERYSAVFFYNPSYATDYAPLPGAIAEAGGPRYRTINWGEFRAGRAAGDYADHGEEIQISQFRISPPEAS